jgi:hypothetical protein
MIQGLINIMKNFRKLLPFLFFGLALQVCTHAYAATYGESLCHSPGYTCVVIKKGDSWEKLAPNLKERDILQRVNRMNIQPAWGSTIAMPVNLSDMTIYDASPFPRYIDPTGTKTIYISQTKLAWGAYDASGNLIWWGPVSPGRPFCADINKSCKTPDGIFYVQRKQGINCVSSQFPLRNPDGSKGGAPMPYCMHFWGGYALHGAMVVPGHADSHGCVRMFTADAKWLNENFIDVPRKGTLGTRIIISEKAL